MIGRGCHRVRPRARIGAGPAGILMLAMLAPAQAADGWRLNLGAERSEGDYGGDINTTLDYLPLSLARRSGAWSWRLQSGWLRLRESAAARGSRATEGAGDTRLTVGYAVPRPLPARIYLDLSLAYKWATAETGLGTGADDQQVEAEFLRRFGATVGFVSLAYRRVGDPPDRDLRDRRQLGLGVSRSGGAALSYGLSLDYRSPLSGTGEPALEWVPFLAWRVDRHWTVSAYAVLGQADGSPDRALGMQLGRRWQD